MRRSIIAALAVGTALLVTGCGRDVVLGVQQTPEPTVSVVPTTPPVPTATPSPEMTPTPPPPTATSAPPPTSTPQTSTRPPPTVTRAPLPTSTPPPPSATATSVPAPTSTPTPEGKPKQRIGVTDQRGDEFEGTDFIQIETRQTLIGFDLDPIALDTGLPVMIAAGPSNVCSWSEDSPGQISLQGGANDTCTVTLTVEENRAFDATEVTVEIQFVPRLVSWTLESGPPYVGCFTPGAVVPSLMYRAAGGTQWLYELQIIDTFYTKPNGVRTSNAFDQLDYSDDRSEDDSRVSFEMTINPNVPAGSRIDVTVGFVSQGTSVVAFDPPESFEWRIENSCP